MIVGKLNKVLGSSIKERATWYVVKHMVGDCVVAFNPFTNRERKFKQYTAFSMLNGYNYYQFFNLPNAGTSRSRMKIQEGVEHQAVIQLPKTTQHVIQRVAPRSEKMVRAVQQYNRDGFVDADDYDEDADDEVTASTTNNNHDMIKTCGNHEMITSQRNHIEIRVHPATCHGTELITR